MKPYEKHESTAINPDDWAVFKSKDASVIADVVRWLIAACGPRMCVCAPQERIVEDDGSCFRCSGRVVRRAPFRDES